MHRTRVQNGADPSEFRLVVIIVLGKLFCFRGAAGIATNPAEPNGPEIGVQRVQVKFSRPGTAGVTVCSSHAVDSAFDSMSAHAPVVLAAPRLT